MAKFTPGSVGGQISGSVGADVFSHNRFGPYIRRRSIPTNPQTDAQTQIRSLTATNSSAWASLTDAQKESWRVYAANNPVTNTLGLKQVLDGHQAYVQLNNVLLRTGYAAIALPPVGMAPDGFATFSLACSLGAPDFQITFTATPLGANDIMVVDAAVVNSAGIRNVNSQFKRIQQSAAAQASPLGIHTALVTYFGTMQIGQKVFVRCAVVDSTTGQMSTPRTASALVTA